MLSEDIIIVLENLKINLLLFECYVFVYSENLRQDKMCQYESKPGFLFFSFCVNCIHNLIVNSGLMNSTYQENWVLFKQYFCQKISLTSGMVS